MIRLAFRQFRTQGVVALGGLVILGILTVVTGPHLVHLYDTLFVGCKSADACGLAHRALSKTDGHLQSWLGALVLVVPCLVGVFWGAPLLAREFENGTFGLVWTQSVTRARWLSVKVGLVGLASMAVAGLTSLMVTWWSSPIDRGNATPFVTFDQRDIVPIAYAAFAFAIGVTSGLLVRRTLPAMVTTLVGFVGVRLAIYEWIRPRLSTPVRALSPLALPGPSGQIAVGTGLRPGAWEVVTEQVINGSGRVVGTSGALNPSGLSANVMPSGAVTLSDGQRCPAAVHGPVGTRTARELSNAAHACATRLHLRDVVTYQPASRYWPFQWYESAIFVVLALLLVALCFWWLRRNFIGNRGTVPNAPIGASTPLPARSAQLLRPQPGRADGRPLASGRPRGAERSSRRGEVGERAASWYARPVPGRRSEA